MNDTVNSKQPLLRVISVLIGGLPYRDRMSMLYALDQHVAEHIIITRDNAGAIPYMHNTHVIKPWVRLPWFLFSLWAGVVSVCKIHKSSEKSPWIVVEDFHKYGLWIVKYFCSNRAITVSSQVMECGSRWNKDPYIGCVSKKQACRYNACFRGNSRHFKALAKAMNAMLVNGEGIKEDILALAPAARVCVIPNSATLLDHGPNHSFKVSRDNGVMFLYVGAMQPLKGIGTLLEGFTRFVKSHPNDRLVMVGRVHSVDRIWFAKIMDCYRNNKQITYMQQMQPTEISAVFEKADVFLFPSFTEGAPRVINEALAYGLPIIASDIPSIRTIDPEGMAIQYFQPGNIVEMNTQMNNVSDNIDVRISLSKQAQKLSLEFTHEKVAARHSVFYKELLQDFSYYKNIA